MIIYITGLSGVGKSSILHVLEKKGYTTMDTDYGYTRLFADGEYRETILDEDKIVQFINTHTGNHLFLSGCYSNQGNLYKYFDCVVLLTADLEVMLHRVSKRTANTYGKSEDEREEIIGNYINVLPLLKKNADMIIDTTHLSVEEVFNQVSKSLYR